MNATHWRGAAQLISATVEETTNLVARTQRGVTRRTMRALAASPLPEPTFAPVGSAINSTAGGVYHTIRFLNWSIGTALDHGLARAENRLQENGQRPAVADAPYAFLSADHAAGILNGLYGDFLHERDNPLALRMSLRRNGREIPPTRSALLEAYPHGTRRLCVFVHGLGCTEAIWRIGAAEYYDDPLFTLGAHLQAVHGITPLYVRYNSGRRVVDNGRLLAALLTQLVQEYPHGVDELVLVGHSMGGLVIRSATRDGVSTAAPWTTPLRDVICVASPHCGAPSAQIADWLSRMLGTIDTAGTQVTAALLDARSAGIKDLRNGAVDEVGAECTTSLPDLRYGFVSAVYHKFTPQMLAHHLGDLVVPEASAHAQCHIQRLETTSVWAQSLSGIDHFQLANHPEVHSVVAEALHLRVGLTEDATRAPQW